MVDAPKTIGLIASPYGLGWRLWNRECDTTEEGAVRYVLEADYAALEAQLAAERTAHAETKQERDEALNQLCSMMYDRDTHRVQCKKLLTQRDEALKALEPFAKAGELFPGDDADFDQCIYRPAAGDEYALSGNHLRAARRALEGGKDAK